MAVYDSEIFPSAPAPRRKSRPLTPTFQATRFTCRPRSGGVAWFWPNPGLREWIPPGEKYRVIVGANTPDAKFLCQIQTDELIRAAQATLATR
jgi:hypothetical protein